MNKMFSALAKTESLQGSFKKLLVDTGKFFDKSQGAFKGVKKTYTAMADTIDQPNYRGNTRVITTVDEKLSYVIETASEYLNAVFDLEKTNSTGVAKAMLIVDDVEFGELSSLELLRLRGILESQELLNMYSNIPVREETKVWNKSDNAEYADRNIWEDDILKGQATTTEKEAYILVDPNTDAGSPNYKAQVAQKETKKILGEYTAQNFSGEFTHTERAHILGRISKLKTAVNIALKEANDCELSKSNMTGTKIFNYLHSGK